MDRIIVKLTWKTETTRMAKMILKRNNKMEGISLLNFKTYCIDIIIKTVWGDRSMGQSREPRKRAIQICPTDYFKKCKGNSMEER